MELQYYQKELVSNSFMVGGAAVPFEVLDGNRGVIAVDPEKDPALVAALNAAAAKRRGGIIKISAEEYAKKKHLHPFNPYVPKLKKDVLRALPPTIKPAGFKGTGPGDAARVVTKPAAPAPAAAPTPQPATPSPGEVQAPVAELSKFRPATRRISRRDALTDPTVP